MAPKEKIPKGPPQELISRIIHLHNLLRNLPKSLPENSPHSLYQFDFNQELLEMSGYFAAAGHALELSFETHLLRIQDRHIRFSERGERNDELQKFLKRAVKEMTPGERDTFKEAWIERLIMAAEAPDPDLDTRPAKKVSGAVILGGDAPQSSVPAVRDATTSASTSTILSPSHGSSPTSSTSTSLPPLPSSSSTASQARQLVGNPKQRGLGSFGWKKATPEDTQKYWSKARDDGAEQRQSMIESQEKMLEAKKERERDLARLRQKRKRERARLNATDERPETTNTVLMRGAKTLSEGTQITDIASLSRPLTQKSILQLRTPCPCETRPFDSGTFWKKNRTGTLGGVIQAPAKKVFWFHPFLFALIKGALERYDWSPSRTVAYLHRTHPSLFNAPNSRLNKGTLWKWIVPKQHRFTDSALLKITSRRSLAGGGRVGILAPYPEIPQDVGIQRVAKHHLRQSMLEHLVRCHQAQVSAGITPENVKFTNSYPALRDASVRACVELYDWLTTPEGRTIVQRSWEKCVVPDKPKYNLSYECLSSRDSRKALRAYLKTDKTIADEIKARLGSISLADLPDDTEDENQPEDCSHLADDDERGGTHQPEDDSDVPLAGVVAGALGIRMNTRSQARTLAAKKVIEEDATQGLSTADAEEDIWAFNDHCKMYQYGGNGF
ncbi:hypothetical protein DFH09DRAFT_941594 [Mycena vulgaris]|nr:hypothetical protein DFH09DRAFT_941594 [Mycena vulgaris]